MRYCPERLLIVGLLLLGVGLVGPSATARAATPQGTDVEFAYFRGTKYVSADPLDVRSSQFLMVSADGTRLTGGIEQLRDALAGITHVTSFEAEFKDGVGWEALSDSNGASWVRYAHGPQGVLLRRHADQWQLTIEPLGGQYHAERVGMVAPLGLSLGYLLSGRSVVEEARSNGRHLAVSVSPNHRTEVLLDDAGRPIFLEAFANGVPFLRRWYGGYGQFVETSIPEYTVEWTTAGPSHFRIELVVLESARLEMAEGTLPAISLPVTVVDQRVEGEKKVISIEGVGGMGVDELFSRALDEVSRSTGPVAPLPRTSSNPNGSDTFSSTVLVGIAALLIMIVVAVWTSRVRNS